MFKKTIAVLALTTMTCSSGLWAQRKVVLQSETDRISYSIGLSIGNNFQEQSIDINLEPLMQGIADAMKREKPLMTDEEIQQTMERFRQTMTAKMQQQKEALADKNQQAGDTFLKENQTKKGIVTTASGLQYQVVQEGTGETPGPTDTVVTHYRGTLLNGQEFDSSYKRGQPAVFPVNGVIRGWTEALQLMKTGAKWKLFIPAQLAYGERGAGNAIGPNETLIFEIELLEINPKQ
jgi:FKBP-type peptidyl-prolyl cis-trans isomerase FklB